MTTLKGPSLWDIRCIKWPYFEFILMLNFLIVNIIKKNHEKTFFAVTSKHKCNWSKLQSVWQECGNDRKRTNFKTIYAGPIQQKQKKKN